jgi:acetyl-CoA carboxylase biotin carboxyl carrier protein
MEINIDIIKDLINSLNASHFDSLRLETADFKLSIDSNAHNEGAAKPAPSVEVNAVAVSSTKEEKVEAPKGTIMRSPIVGTFYAAPAQDKPPYVKVGQKVKRGDIIYIIESMKLMNEIESECDGTVAEIYVENGQPVEYNQPIMRIE